MPSSSRAGGGAQHRLDVRAQGLHGVRRRPGPAPSARHRLAVRQGRLVAERGMAGDPSARPEHRAVPDERVRPDLHRGDDHPPVLHQPGVQRGPVADRGPLADPQHRREVDVGGRDGGGGPDLGAEQPQIGGHHGGAAQRRQRREGQQQVRRPQPQVGRAPQPVTARPDAGRQRSHQQHRQQPANPEVRGRRGRRQRADQVGPRSREEQPSLLRPVAAGDRARVVRGPGVQRDGDRQRDHEEQQVDDRALRGPGGRDRPAAVPQGPRAGTGGRCAYAPETPVRGEVCGEAAYGRVRVEVAHREPRADLARTQE